MKITLLKILLDCWDVLVFFSEYYPAKYIEEKKKAALYTAEHKKEFKEYVKEKYGKEAILKNIRCEVDADINSATKQMNCRASEILSGDVLWNEKTVPVTYCPTVM